MSEGKDNYAGMEQNLHLVLQHLISEVDLILCDQDDLLDQTSTNLLLNVGDSGDMSGTVDGG